MKLLLLIAAMVAGASSFVYTCNEIKRILESDDDFSVNATRACVVLPTDVKFPYNAPPYSWYLYNTYLVDTGSASMPKELSGIVGSTDFCIDGVGPWTITSDDVEQFQCTDNANKIAEIAFIFTSDEPNFVVTSITPTPVTLTQGTHVFVSLEDALQIDKVAIADGKETTFTLYSGAGQDDLEERFAMMPEKFVPGTTTVILGPVTTLVIEDDVKLDLVLTAITDEKDISAAPGFSYSIMTTGRANNQQSSRNIKISTHFGINDDTIAYDAVSITGTVLMDDALATTLSIDCSSEETGDQGAIVIDKTRDVIINDKCTALEIKYKGSIAAADIDRSSEVIYLRIESSPDPVHKTTRDPAASPEPTGTVTTRRTLPPTSSRPTPPPGSTASRLLSTMSTTRPSTTTSSGVATVVSSVVLAGVLAVL